MILPADLPTLPGSLPPGILTVRTYLGTALTFSRKGWISSLRYWHVPTAEGSVAFVLMYLDGLRWVSSADFGDTEWRDGTTRHYRGGAARRVLDFEIHRISKLTNQQPN
jgi:hypothetical protein